MHLSPTNHGLGFDFTALVPALTKGYTQYQGVKNQIQIERSRANAAAEQSRIASAAAAAARSAQARGGVLRTALPYLVAAGAGVALLVYLTRR